MFRSDSHRWIFFIYIIPLAVLLAGLILWALFWAIRAGQFDDLERPGHEIFWDDPADPPKGLPHPRRESARAKPSGKK